MLCENFLEGVEDLDAHAESLREFGCAERDDHELLEIDGVIGVGASVQDVHHGNGQGGCTCAAEVAIQGGALGSGGRAGGGQGDRQDRVGPKAALVRSAIQVKHDLVYAGLLRSVMREEGFSDLSVDGGDRLGDAFTEIAGLIAIAEFDGFMLAVEAPEGTAARPMLPSARKTSASTVGLPRESSISVPVTRTIVDNECS